MNNDPRLPEKTPHEGAGASRRYWFRFRLRTLLLLVLVCACGAWVIAQRKAEDEKRVALTAIKPFAHSYEISNPSASGPNWSTLLFAADPRGEVVELQLNTRYSDKDWFRSLYRFKKLRSLTVFTDSEGQSEEALGAIADVKSLERLCLFQATVPGPLLKQIVANRNLKILDLYLSKLKDDDIACLATCAQLEVLKLAESRVGDAGLIHLKNLTNLQELGLGTTPVTDVGLKNLAGLTNLERLDLGFTDIGDDGIHYLRALTKVKVLNLPATRITDGAFSTITSFTDLEELNVIDCPSVTRLGMKQLEPLAKLKFVQLSQGKLSDDEVQTWRSVLPNVKLGFYDAQGNVVREGMP